MTINELKKLRKRRQDGIYKRKVVASLHLGFNDRQTICKELKISRTLLRRWIRWDYRVRVLKLIAPMDKKKKPTYQELEKQLNDMHKKLKEEQLRNEAYGLLLDFAKEKHDLDLRKKDGAPLWGDG